MRRLGETGFVVGFDGPRLHLSKPRDELRDAAVALMLSSIQRPRLHRDSAAAARAAAAGVSTDWDAMDGAERARLVGPAHQMAEELIDKVVAFKGLKHAGF